jgi:hypothetical protein
MAKVSFMGVLDTEFELPAGWEERSIASFTGPVSQGPEMRTTKVSKMRTSYTVTSEPAASTDLTAIKAKTPVPRGVDLVKDEISTQKFPHFLRVLRFKDPITGMLIQQRHQVFHHQGRRYTAILSCEPLRYGTEARMVELTPLMK